MSMIKAYLDLMRERGQPQDGRDDDQACNDMLRDDEEYHQWLDSLPSKEDGSPTTSEANSTTGEK